MYKRQEQGHTGLFEQLLQTDLLLLELHRAGVQPCDLQKCGDQPVDAGEQLVELMDQLLPARVGQLRLRQQSNQQIDSCLLYTSRCV